MTETHIVFGRTIVHNLTIHTVSFFLLILFFPFSPIRRNWKGIQTLHSSLFQFHGNWYKEKKKYINFLSIWLRYFYCFLNNQSSGNAKIEVPFIFLLPTVFSTAKQSLNFQEYELLNSNKPKGHASNLTTCTVLKTESSQKFQSDEWKEGSKQLKYWDIISWPIKKSKKKI